MSRGPHRPKRPIQQITSLDQLPLLCTSDEAARFLRCTVEQVQKLARLGGLPGFKAADSRSWLFRRDDLLNYIDQIVKGGTPT